MFNTTVATGYHTGHTNTELSLLPKKTCWMVLGLFNNENQVNINFRAERDLKECLHLTNGKVRHNVLE